MINTPNIDWLPTGQAINWNSTFIIPCRQIQNLSLRSILKITVLERNKESGGVGDGNSIYFSGKGIGGFGGVYCDIHERDLRSQANSGEDPWKRRHQCLLFSGPFHLPRQTHRRPYCTLYGRWHRRPYVSSLLFVFIYLDLILIFSLYLIINNILFYLLFKFEFCLICSELGVPLSDW